MSCPPRKTDMVIDYMKAGEWKQALKIAKTFKLGLSKEQQADIRRAFEVTDIQKAGTYQQLGFTISELFDRGVAVLQQVYGGRL